MARWLVTIAVACQACVLVPRTVITREEVVIERTRTMERGARTFVHAHVAGDAIVVDAARFGRCFDEERVVEEVRTRKRVGLDMNMPNGGHTKIDEAVGAFWLLGSLVTFPISTIITLGIVAADHHEVVSRSAPTTRVTEAMCPPTPLRGAVVELVLPSGLALHATATGDGRATFALPTDDGPWLVRVAGRDIEIDPRRPPSCADERIASLARLDATPERDRAALVATLPRCGDASAKAWSILERAALAASRDCSRIRADDEAMRALDPAFRDEIFAKEPHIARCLEIHEACGQHRIELMTRARDIADANERGRYLSSISDCDR
jgi:hypothetical protein